jgi:hypothetical protein
MAGHCGNLIDVLVLVPMYLIPAGTRGDKPSFLPFCPGDASCVQPFNISRLEALIMQEAQGELCDQSQLP